MSECGADLRCLVRTTDEATRALLTLRDAMGRFAYPVRVEAPVPELVDRRLWADRHLEALGWAFVLVVATAVVAIAFALGS